MPAKVLRFVGMYLFANLFAVGMLILVTGMWPRTPTGWIVLVAFGFPSWIFGEFVAAKVLSNKISKAIDPSEKAVSFFRIGYAFLVAILTFALIVGIYYIFTDFWQKHFITWASNYGLKLTAHLG